MATFLVHWERFGRLTDRKDELDNWRDCYEQFGGPTKKTKQQARDFIDRIKYANATYGVTRRYKIYKLVEVVD